MSCCKDLEISKKYLHEINNLPSENSNIVLSNYISNLSGIASLKCLYAVQASKQTFAIIGAFQPLIRLNRILILQE